MDRYRVVKIELRDTKTVAEMIQDCLNRNDITGGRLFQVIQFQGDDYAIYDDTPIP